MSSRVSAYSSAKEREPASHDGLRISKFSANFIASPVSPCSGSCLALTRQGQQLHEMGHVADQPSVDPDQLTVDVAGRVAREENRDIGDVLRLTEKRSGYVR